MRKINLTIILLFAFILTACSNNESLPFVTIDNQTEHIPEKVEEPENAIRVGIASVISPQATRVGYDSLIKYLEEKLNAPITLIQGKTYAETNQLIEEGKIDIAFICSLSYVLGVEGEYMQGLAAPKVSGKPLYRSYIIVRKDSGIETLDDLMGRKFAFTDPDSYSGRLSALYLLKQKGQSAEDFFAKTYYTYSHDYSVKAVATGLVDGAAVDNLVYDQMKSLGIEDSKDLKIIEYGDWVGTPPIVVSNYISEEIKRKTQDILFNMNRDEMGRKILEGLNIEQFVPVDYESYQPIIDMLNIVGDER